MDPATAPQTIRKPAGKHGVAPNMCDYARERATFTWTGAAERLAGLPAGRGINIAHEAIDRHVLAHRADHLAVRWLGKDGTQRDYTYRDLCGLTNRVANVLRGLELRPGARVFILAGAYRSCT